MLSSECISFLKKVFGIVERYSGGNCQVKCPACLEVANKEGYTLNKRKLSININKNFIFHCWVCSYKGHFINLLKKYYDYEIVNEFIKLFCNNDYIKKVKQDNDIQLDKIKLPEDYRLIILNHKDKLGMEAYKYLLSRGLKEEDMWYFRIGISEEKGWRKRVIFPSFDENGELNAYCGRLIFDVPFGKYKDVIRGDKTELIFNEINIDWNNELTLCEGVFDLVKTNQNSTPLLGSMLRKDSYLLHKILVNKTPILLALDPDMAHKTMPVIIDMFLKYQHPFRVLRYCDYTDIGSMNKSQFEAIQSDAVVWERNDLIKHKIKSIHTRNLL